MFRFEAVCYSILEETYVQVVGDKKRRADDDSAPMNDGFVTVEPFAFTRAFQQNAFCTARVTVDMGANDPLGFQTHECSVMIVDDPADEGAPKG